MKNSYFQALEPSEHGRKLDLDPFFEHLAFNDAGLIPVVTQDASSKQVLMLAWMNRESLEQTLSKGRMVYWSRSRNELWAKGETSGHVQTLRSMHVDCDGDAILCLVDQKGAACHTGRPDCFYFEVDASSRVVTVSGTMPGSV